MTAHTAYAYSRGRAERCLFLHWLLQDERQEHVRRPHAGLLHAVWLLRPEVRAVRRRVIGRAAYAARVSSLAS